MPIKYKDMITTPHELVYKEKPDYRFPPPPIFSVTYVKRYKDGTKNDKNLKARLLNASSWAMIVKVMEDYFMYLKLKA
mgnify:CR=1 FL=1